MATSIGPKIGVDGYNEFKVQMDTITSKLKTLETQAAALEKQYQGQTDSVEYLTKKQELYNEQLKLQQQRLEEAAKWQEKVTTYVNGKAEASERDNLAVAKAGELTAKYNLALQGTEAELNKTNEELDNYGRKLLTSADAAEDMRDRTSAAAVAIGNVMARLIEKAADLGKTMIQTGIEFNATMEGYQASYSTLLGSQAEAKKALSGILETATQAPTFSIGALADANRSLLATGETAEGARQKIIDLATALAAAGQGDDALRRMAANLQQIANNGQAFAIDIKQFNNVGVPVWNMLADYTGKTKAELADTVITFEMLSGAFAQAAGEGGRFYGALDAQAQTLNGQINALKNNITRGLGAAFQNTTDALETKVLPALNKFFSSEDSMKNLVAVVEGTATAIGTLAIAAKLTGWESSKAFLEATTMVERYKLAVQKGIISQHEMTGAMTGTQVMAGLLSGQLTLAEAAQWGLNAAMNAMPLITIAALLGSVVYGLENYKNIADKVKAAEIIDTDSLEEAEAHLAELQEKLETMRNTHPSERGAEFAAEWDGTKAAIEETMALIEQLKVKEQETAAAMADPANQLQSIVDQTKETISGLYAAYDEAYAKAYEAAQKEFELFEYIEGVSYTATEDMIKALDSQTLYWDNYVANLEIVRDANFGLSQDLIKFLSDGSQESAGYLQSIINDVNAAGGATSEGGQAIIRDINNSFSELQRAQDEYASTSALTATDLEKNVAKTIDDMIAAMNELEITDEMRQSAAADMQAFASELSSQSTLLNSQSYQIGQAIALSLQSGINSVSISLPTFGGTYARNSGKVEKFASGLDYVPYDEFPAYLHKGEMVLTAADAAAYRSGNVTNTNNRTTNYGGVAINVFAAEGQSVDEIADAVAYKLQSAVEGRERAG